MARASAFQAEGRGFEARLPLQLLQAILLVDHFFFHRKKHFQPKAIFPLISPSRLSFGAGARTHVITTKVVIQFNMLLLASASDALCPEKGRPQGARLGLDYGKDRLEPSDTHSRVVRVVDRSGAFPLFRMSRRDMKCCSKPLPAYQRRNK